MNKFKKLSVAAAVCAGLGGAGMANAITQGEPGDALLVPYVLVDTANSINTLVGLTFPSAIGIDPVPSVIGGVSPAPASFTTTASSAATVDGSQCINTTTGQAAVFVVHWFFFNPTSQHLINSTFAVTCDDFYGFDWNTEATNAGGIGDVDGLPGYLVFADNRATNGTQGSSLAMFGDAAQIRGNWASAAYIPVIPMVDDQDSTFPGGQITQGVDEVVYNISGVPANVSPLTAGMPLDNDDGDTNDGADFDMRYFLDPALGGGTDMVVWMDRNCRSNTAPPAGDGCNRTNVPVDVFDTEEQTVSDSLDLSLELNIIDAATLNGTTHTDADGSVNSGFVFIRLPEVTDNGTVLTNPGGPGPDTSGVAFSLIEFSGGANPTQVQTALAHERGIINF